jgi:D-alanine-D-alanine ligase
MSKKVTVGVVFGGASTEAAVSRKTAESVFRALIERDFEPKMLECDGSLPARLEGCDVVFPAVHGRFGEDGCLQGMLEILGIPYVGSNVLASAMANDKAVSKACFRAANVPVIEDILVTKTASKSPEKQVFEALGKSVVVKPTCQGSAIGVSILKDLSGPGDARLRTALEVAFSFDDRVLIEAFADGLEVTCGVLDLHGQQPIALPPTLIVPKSADWYDFKAKYAAGGSEHVCPAPFRLETNAAIQRAALAAHKSVMARDFSRTDFVVNEAWVSRPAIVALEINTIPGMTATSLYPEAARAAGIAFPDLIARLVKSAMSRGRTQKQIAVDFPGE